MDERLRSEFEWINDMFELFSGCDSDCLVIILIFVAEKVLKYLVDQSAIQTFPDW